MKKSFIYLFSILMMAAVAGCNTKNNPTEPDGQPTDSTTNTPSVPVAEATFPMKHIIEEFTGQDCGYCPAGMDYVHAFIGSSENIILMMHHDGYTADNFTVAGSSTICKKLKVNGAPSISVDRNKKIKSLFFHPAYLEEIPKSKLAAETYVSANIENTYDAGSRQLKVNVTGQVGKADAPQLFLTLIVKESGMVDYQADYYNTYEGWQEFRHISAARVFLTAALGDSLRLTQDKDGRLLYSAEYTTTLGSQWDADKCAVVAIISEGSLPIVQCEEQPVVTGTDGGRSIQHGGITPVPVSEQYPEPENGNGPFDYYTAANTIPFTTSHATYKTYSQYGFNYWQLMVYNESLSITCEGTACIPFAYLYIFTQTSQTTIPEGTYELNGTMTPGTAWAGYRDDEHFEIGGSKLYFTSKAYFDQNYLVPAAEWLIASGTLTVRSDGWTLTGQTRSGKDIRMQGGAIQNGGQSSVPARMIQNRPLGFEYEFKRLSVAR